MKKRDGRNIGADSAQGLKIPRFGNVRVVRLLSKTAVKQRLILLWVHV